MLSILRFANNLSLSLSLPHPMTPLGFEPMTSALLPLVRPQTLPTLLKVIVVRKCAYPSLIVHSPKRPRRTIYIQTELSLIFLINNYLFK